MTDLIAVLAALLPAVSASPCLVLDGLDVQRQIAYAAAAPGLLSQLYAEDSVAGREDVESLAAYRERGLRVHGVRLQRRSCQVLDETTVEVVERLGPAAAVDTDGVWRRLPQDHWDRRRITLVVQDGRWRLADSISTLP